MPFEQYAISKADLAAKILQENSPDAFVERDALRINYSWDRPQSYFLQIETFCSVPSVEDSQIGDNIVTESHTVR